MLRYYKEGQSSVPAYLEDYALLASGCLALYTQTLEEAWLEESRMHFSKSLIELFFHDEESGLFYDRGSDQEQLIVRQRGSIDNDIPSGNAATADRPPAAFPYDRRREITGAGAWDNPLPRPC